MFKRNVIISLFVLLVVIVILPIIMYLTCSWSEATYWTPSTCKLCFLNFVKGETLTPSFIKDDWEHNYGHVVELDEEIPFTTSSESDYNVEVSGTVKFTNYREFEKNEKYDGRGGYAWQVVDMVITIEDDFHIRFGSFNYYMKDFSEDVNRADTDTTSNTEVVQKSVIWKDQEFDECDYKWEKVEDEANNTITYTFLYRRPKGYDGEVIYLKNYYDHVNNILDKDTYVFFRLKRPEEK